MPILIAAELNNIEGIDSSSQEGFVVIATHAFRPIDENGFVTQLPPGLPGNVGEPSGAHVVTTQLQVFVTHHVEQD